MQKLTYSDEKSCEAHLNGFLEHLCVLLSVHMLRGGGWGGFRKPLSILKIHALPFFNAVPFLFREKVALHSAAAVRKRAVRCAEAARSGRNAEEKQITFTLLFSLLALLFENGEGCTNINLQGNGIKKTVWMSVSYVILIMRENSLTTAKSLSLLWPLIYI